MSNLTTNGAAPQVNSKYDVLLEKMAENGYQARILAWPDCVVQASTREDVIALARTVILENLAKAEIVTIEIGPEETKHAWLPFAGDWADDPGIEDFRATIEENRRAIDAIWSPWMLEPEESAAVEEQPVKSQSIKEVVLA